VIVVPEEQLYQLGVLMLTGKIPNRPASRSDAFSIWRRVLAQNPNHLNTKFSLGTALLLTPISATATEETIQSVESMKKEGYSLLSEAADGGHAWAMANMAQHLLKQSEVNSSLMRRAANLLTKAWEAGQVPIAPYNLYQLYSTMAKTQVDPQAAESIALSEKWLKIGADKVNDVTSQYQLACALQRRNDDTWVDYMKRAADAGLTMAQHNLAVHLLDKADFSEAMRYFRAASNAGFIHSTFNLGLMYLNGQGLSAPDAASARVYLSQVYVSGDEAMKQQVTEHMDPFSKNSLLS
jgi:TPR repeat protein